MKRLNLPVNIMKFGMALQHLSTYLQEIGETAGSYPAKFYGGKYITKIRQTKTQIIVEVIC